MPAPSAILNPSKSPAAGRVLVLTAIRRKLVVDPTHGARVPGANRAHLCALLGTRARA